MSELFSELYKTNCDLLSIIEKLADLCLKNVITYDEALTKLTEITNNNQLLLAYFKTSYNLKK